MTQSPTEDFKLSRFGDHEFQMGLIFAERFSESDRDILEEKTGTTVPDTEGAKSIYLSNEIKGDRIRGKDALHLDRCLRYHIMSMDPMIGVREISLEGFVVSTSYRESCCLLVTPISEEVWLYGIEELDDMAPFRCST